MFQVYWVNKSMARQLVCLPRVELFHSLLMHRAIVGYVTGAGTGKDNLNRFEPSSNDD